jgi:hypothetical protein
LGLLCSLIQSQGQCCGFSASSEKQFRVVEHVRAIPFFSNSFGSSRRAHKQSPSNDKQATTAPQKSQEEHFQECEKKVEEELTMRVPFLHAIIIINSHLTLKSFLC